jgi:hypothetical protein
MRKFVCIHGHFYQPPREDPWTRNLGEEKSAYPFHDWNERITAECYAPNSASEVTDQAGRARETMNNYAWISCDFGPTLLRWLESRHPEVHEAIVEADRQSLMRFGGHGSAMAQVYNHMIMPLANAEDRRVQTKWGIADFTRRFGRDPEGMWLPETAVDLDSLEALAESGIKFTILSPHQALGVRREGETEWTDTSEGRIDTKRAYFCALPSGKRICLFFYDRGLSTGLAFGDLLNSGEAFSGALLGAFGNSQEDPLVSVASDGETYGHHRKNGHRVLSDCLARLREGKVASVTNYGHYLSLFPPTHEVRIAERTSWSCAHGVERWKGNCGCGSEIHPGFNQEWRAPLRLSLNWLREQVDQTYLEQAPGVMKDPEEARHQLPSAMGGGSSAVRRNLRATLKPARSEKRGAELLEMVECSYLMLASCAWFWEDMSRMETVQMLRFARRAIELANGSNQGNLSAEFKKLLSEAKPNDRTFKDGADLYDSLAAAPRGS